MPPNEQEARISRCPVCDGELVIDQLQGAAREPQIESVLAVPAFFRLAEDQPEFVLVFSGVGAI